MTAQEFHCPNCGAPLDPDGTSATIRCTYCDTSVIVPAELRPKPQPEPQSTLQPTVITFTSSQRVPASRSSSSSCLLWSIVGGIVLTIVVVIIISNLAVSRATKIAEDSFEIPVMALATDIPAPTEVPVEPTPTPTPSFARLVATFGSEGIGPGLLSQAEHIAIDGSGTLYIANYRDGRVQVFDPDGKYLRGWQMGEGKTSIYGLAATQDGTVYVSYGGEIYRYEGATGKALGKLDYANGKEFGSLAALPNGGILGVWYEGRWGLITSLDGHRDDLVWFDAEGNVVRTLESFISGQTDNAALDTKIAVDGLGTIYALSTFDDTVFKFSAQGKYIDRFGESGSGPGKISGADSIAVDGQGRVYIGGSSSVSIFSPVGALLASFPVEKRAVSMAFSQPGDLYILSWDSVARYTLDELP